MVGGPTSDYRITGRGDPGGSRRSAGPPSSEATVPDGTSGHSIRTESGGVNLWIAFVVPLALLMIPLALQWLETSLLGRSLRRRVRAATDRLHVLSRPSRASRIRRRRASPPERGHADGADGRMERPVHPGRWTFRVMHRRASDRTRRRRWRGGPAPRPRGPSQDGPVKAGSESGQGARSRETDDARAELYGRPGRQGES